MEQIISIIWGFVLFCGVIMMFIEPQMRRILKEENIKMSYFELNFFSFKVFSNLLKNVSIDKNKRESYARLYRITIWLRGLICLGIALSLIIVFVWG